MFKQIFNTVVLFAIVATGYAQTKIIPFSSPELYYEGRIMYHTDAAELSWTGTSVSICFEGKTMSAILQDRDTANYYNVIVDNKLTGKIHSTLQKQAYVLASGLTAGKHKVELFKRTEWDKGKTLFYGFEAPSETQVLPYPNDKSRKIEFYGNSITCGYAMEDLSGNDSWHGFFENGYLSYAALTARHYNASYNCISKSGIGIMLSWFSLIMPEMYDRLDPTDPDSKWDFNQYTPDIVVINLFQNDSWLVKKHDHEQFIKRFGKTEPTESFIIEAYKNFVISIRTKYPKAKIICALGNMDATRDGSPWPGYIRKAISQLNDSEIYTHFFPYKNTNGHPKVSEQKAMAKSLIEFIDRNQMW